MMRPANRIAMRYISTRGRAPVLNFSEVTLAGLASDGGLYVPEVWPSFTLDEIAQLRGLPYAQLAARVMAPFVGDCLSQSRLQELCEEAYGRFAHAAVTPHVKYRSDVYVTYRRVCQRNTGIGRRHHPGRLP